MLAVQVRILPVSQKKYEVVAQLVEQRNNFMITFIGQINFTSMHLARVSQVRVLSTSQ